MKGIIVSINPSLLAFAGRFFLRLIKAAAQGRVNAPNTHPRLTFGLSPLNIQTSMLALYIRQGLL
jgi:hypothetical protein